MPRIYQGVIITDEQYAEFEAARLAAPVEREAVAEETSVELTPAQKRAATIAAKRAAAEAEAAAIAANEETLGTGEPVAEAETLPSGDERVEGLDPEGADVDAAIDAAGAE